MYSDILNQGIFLVIAELGVSWECTKPELDKKTLANIPSETKPGDQLTTAFPVLLSDVGWSDPLCFLPPCLCPSPWGSAGQCMWDRSPGMAASQGSPST